jgi:uncharacterized membrane protein HdeD (DUF308 family)
MDTRPGFGPDDIDTWPVAMTVGLITVALGVTVLVWPSETLTVVSVLLGIQILIFGVFRLISAFSSRTEAPGLIGFVGVIGMVIGVAVLRHPFEAVAVLAALLGIAWIVSGAIELIGAVADPRNRHRALTAFAGVLSIGAGIVVVSWPAPTVTVIAWIAGLYLAGFGVVLCGFALRLRGLER